MKKYLCIEDNPDNMMLVRRVLQSRGYQLLEAETGAGGARAGGGPGHRARSCWTSTCRISTDMRSPAGCATDLNHRTGRASPSSPITANALKGDARKSSAAGCDVYMSKPINIHELWARVKPSSCPIPENRIRTR